MSFSWILQLWTSRACLSPMLDRPCRHGRPYFSASLSVDNPATQSSAQLLAARLTSHRLPLLALSVYQEHFQYQVRQHLQKCLHLQQVTAGLSPGGKARGTVRPWQRVQRILLKDRPQNVLRPKPRHKSNCNSRTDLPKPTNSKLLMPATSTVHQTKMMKTHHLEIHHHLMSHNCCPPDLPTLENF
jgi:hypothetical protein